MSCSVTPLSGEYADTLPCSATGVVHVGDDDATIQAQVPDAGGLGLVYAATVPVHERSLVAVGLSEVHAPRAPARGILRAVPPACRAACRTRSRQIRTRCFDSFRI